MKSKNKKITKKEIKRYYPKYNRGLTLYQVNKRESEELINDSKIKTNRSYWEIIYTNLFTFFNILLVIIGAILIFFQMWTSCVFLIILILNLTIGLVQDIRSKIIVDKLSLFNKEKITVIRDGKEQLISVEKLVLDDVVILKSDMQIPCDAKVIYGEISVNESLVTGESIPLKKLEGSNLLSGTYVTNGRCYAQVCAVGKDNYVQKLQEKAKNYKAPKSQMFSTLNKIFKVITLFVIIFGICDIIQIFSFNYISNPPAGSFDAIYIWLKENVVGQISGALISMIPSGMYLLASASLTAGIISLSKQKIVVQDMYSIETVARIDTLCIDKTGTITDGTMSVFDYEIQNNSFKKPIFEAIMGSVLYGTNDDNFTAKALIDKFGNKSIFESKEVIPFSSIYKYSAAELKGIGTFVIGAYGFVPLEDLKLKKKVDEYSKKGYRVLIVGYSKKGIINGKTPSNLIPVALITLQDHIRKDAKEVISWFKNNDVKIKIISGDNELTVAEIAKNVGVEGADKHINLEGIPLENIKDLVEEYNVFGRASPEQKEAIINSLKANKHTVGMFGDGINDLLGLRSANVSISVACGSKAAKDISSLILVENDFSKLPSIVAQGRRVINNLQRTCSLFLTKTIFSIILNAFFLIFGSITQFTQGTASLWPFLPNTFYAWEIITIGMSSFFLALEPNNERVKGSFIKNIFRKALPNGLIISFALIAYFIYSNLTGLTNNANIDRTICTYIISISSLFVLLQVCFPFNLFRSSVFFGSCLLTGVLFTWSIYGNEMNNWLMLYPDQAPRLLDGKYVGVVVIFIAIILVVMMIVFAISNKTRLINMFKNIKEKFNERHRNTNTK